MPIVFELDLVCKSSFLDIVSASAVCGLNGCQPVPGGRRRGIPIELNGSIDLQWGTSALLSGATCRSSMRTGPNRWNLHRGYMGCNGDLWRDCKMEPAKAGKGTKGRKHKINVNPFPPA
ncbi:hypothetical protein FKM82_022096 [Ascaphus truei]